MEFFTDLIFSVIITLAVILLPYIIIYMIKGKISVEAAKKATIIISIYSFVVFLILAFFTDGEAPTIFPIILWNFIGNRIISPSKHPKNQKEEQSLDTSEDVTQNEITKDNCVLEEEETDFSDTFNDDVEISPIKISNEEEKKLKNLKILSVFLLVCVIALSIVTVSEYAHISKIYDSVSEIQELYDALKHRNELLVEKNNKLNDEIEELNNEIQSNNNKLSFYEEHAVCVDEQSNYYHTYGKCDYFDDSSFWIYNLEAAKDHGYTPCPVCFK